MALFFRCSSINSLGGTIPQTGVGPDVVVVPPPLLNLEAGIDEIQKPVCGETLVAKAAVKALDVGILNGFAWTDERELHAVPIRPDVERPRNELGPVIDDQGAWEPALGRQRIERRNHAGCRQRSVRIDARAFARELIDHR